MSLGWVRFGLSILRLVPGGRERRKERFSPTKRPVFQSPMAQGKHGRPDLTGVQLLDSPVYCGNGRIFKHSFPIQTDIDVGAVGTKINLI